MTNINEIYQSNYLTAADLQGKEPTVTITQVEIAKMNDGQVKICIFANNRPKGIILNKTNARAVSSMYGEETDRWIGSRVKLVTVWTDYQGKPVKAIRVVPPENEKPSAPVAALAAQAPVSTPAHADDYGARMDDEVPF